MVIAGKKVFLTRFVRALKFLKWRGLLKLYVDNFFFFQEESGGASCDLYLA